MLADIPGNLGVDIEGVWRLVPISSLAEAIRAGALRHLDAGIIDLRQVCQVGCVPGVARPELLKIGRLQHAARHAE